MPSPETFVVPSLSETFRKRSHTVPAPSPFLKRRCDPSLDSTDQLSEHTGFKPWQRGREFNFLMKLG
ncbi:hypothetical protein F2Q70_00005309 [Brassica cretica]|uniref:Uncharacterized protein n=1 Tax=Brassica cretica TaxID=69181 RepID=A0A8S9ING8_BRACR|nr:hypothetical protein F2Q70_00005309 [Brassica cretica]